MKKLHKSAELHVPLEDEEDGDDDWIFEAKDLSKARGLHTLLADVGRTVNLESGYLQGLLVSSEKKWQEMSKKSGGVEEDTVYALTFKKSEQNQAFDHGF